MKKLLYFSLVTSLFLSCNPDEYSPNQKFGKYTPQQVNAKQIASLPNKPAGAKIRIAVSGDTQRMYKEAQLFVNLINSRNDIDFVVINGDISDFGQLLEFEGIYKIYNQLKVPFIAVVGNHDLVANGPDIYRRMFGDFNFTFNYAGVKFVCHDSNSREYNFTGKVPDLNWLQANLKLDQNTNHIVAFSHVPPIDDDFDPKLRVDYEQLFNNTPGMLASIHAHQHAPDKVYKTNGTGIPFIITNAIVNRAFTILDISNGDLQTHSVNF